MKKLLITLVLSFAATSAMAEPTVGPGCFVRPNDRQVECIGYFTSPTQQTSIVFTNGTGTWKISIPGTTTWVCAASSLDGNPAGCNNAVPLGTNFYYQPGVLFAVQRSWFSANGYDTIVIRWGNWPNYTSLGVWWRASDQSLQFFGQGSAGN